MCRKRGPRVCRDALDHATPRRTAGLAVMNAIAIPFDPSAFQLRLLLWPVLFGLGAYLLLTSQPMGRPKPDLAEKLRRLDVDERIRVEMARQDTRQIFTSRL